MTYTTRNKNEPPQWGLDERRRSAIELMAMNAGERLPGRPSPLTEARLLHRAEWDTHALARDELVTIYGDHVLAWDDRRIMGAAIERGIYGDLFADSANARVLTRQPKLLEKPLAFTAPVEQKNFLEHTCGTVELAVGVDDATEQVRVWQKMDPVATGVAIALRSAPIRIRFPVWDVYDDLPGARSAIIDAVTLSAAQAEAGAAFSVLSDNGNMQDGQPLFSESAGNLVEGLLGSELTLDSGIGALRSQVLSGRPIDAEPHILMVPSDDESMARALVRAAFGDTGPQVIASAYLDSGAWYLAADPAIWPCIVRGTMQGANGISLRFTRGGTNEHEGARDVILEGLHTYRYAAVSRAGIVKIVQATP